MRKKLILGTISVVILCSLFGCGKKKKETIDVASDTDAGQETTETTQKATATDATATDAEEELKYIGVEIKNGYSAVLTNLTGQDIVSVRIYDSVSGEYCDNLLAENDVFTSNEQRILYYEDKSLNEDEGAADEKLISVGYDIEIILSDESNYVLHGFPFEAIEEGLIFVEDEVAFIEYDGYSTKDAELAIREAEEAANSVKKPKQNTTQQQISNPEPPSAPAEPAPTVTTEIVAEPAPEEPIVDQDVEDCIGDEGLTY